MLERMQGSRINDQRCHMPTYVQVTMATLFFSFITIATRSLLPRKRVSVIYVYFNDEAT